MFHFTDSSFVSTSILQPFIPVSKKRDYSQAYGVVLRTCYDIKDT